MTEDPNAPMDKVIDDELGHSSQASQQPRGSPQPLLQQLKQQDNIDHEYSLADPYRQAKSTDHAASNFRAPASQQLGGERSNLIDQSAVHVEEISTSESPLGSQYNGLYKAQNLLSGLDILSHVTTAFEQSIYQTCSHRSNGGCAVDTRLPPTNPENSNITSMDNYPSTSNASELPQKTATTQFRIFNHPHFPPSTEVYRESHNPEGSSERIHPDSMDRAHDTEKRGQNGEGSNSPLSAESTNSYQTDTGDQFYESHHGYQEQAISTTLPEHHPEDSTIIPAPEQPTTSSEQPEPEQSENTVVLPHDGYYPTSLHVDSEISDTDSAIGSDIQSSTVSLRSSLYESIIENGRTYHKYKEGQYYLPNDDAEQDRLNLQHHLWTLTLDGRLHLAPIENPQRVLDVGTGTGLWALEYAERYPSAIVIGTGRYPETPAVHQV
jgi:hypothetical protein